MQSTYTCPDSCNTCTTELPREWTSLPRFPERKIHVSMRRGKFPGILQFAGAGKGIWLMQGGTQQEMDRMDIYHKFFLVARREVLHSAPFTPNFDGPRVLDLGTGTGIWAIDMAEYVADLGFSGRDNWDRADIFSIATSR